jgi:hypothetical protein
MNSYFWTEPEIKLLKQEYNGRSPARKCVKLLKERLNIERSIYAIQHKAKEYGLQCVQLKSFPRGGEDWSESEDKFLLENRQKHSIYWCCEKLGRSMASVNWRCSHLKINADSRDGWYTLAETAEILGIHISLIRELVRGGKLKATRRNENKGVNSDWEVTEKAIYTFITQFPQFLQNRHPDMVQLVEILTKGDIKYKV